MTDRKVSNKCQYKAVSDAQLPHSDELEYETVTDAQFAYELQERTRKCRLVNKLQFVYIKNFLTLKNLVSLFTCSVSVVLSRTVTLVARCYYHTCRSKCGEGQARRGVETFLNQTTATSQLSGDCIIGKLS